MLIDNLKKIAAQFAIEGKTTEITPFGDGLINTTYLVKTDKEPRKYILQKINQYVFPEPWKVMANLYTINQHIYSKSDIKEISTSIQITRPVDSLSGSNYNLILEKDDAWRMIEFIPNTKTIKSAETPEIAYEAARAFGKFNQSLSDLNPDLIHTTIPGYHGYTNRLEKLDGSIKEDKAGRITDCKEEIDGILDRNDYLKHMNYLIDGKHIPLRVTHNDTKIDNVLFDQDGMNAVGVIDLDTVMPATVLYDFGDMVRFNCNNTREDDPDTGKIRFMTDIFERIASGFLEDTKSFLVDNEKENLVFGGLFFTWIQAVRFLTDYLMDDVYYMTKHPEHNLDRTKNQLAFLKLMEKRRKEMEEIVENCK